ncbi:hypothetical protein [Nostoc sp. MG11]|uniref:Y-family DNA polymerase n=1 Tax=Nostoc sp. MG11 TaxID=2721166 RepID=UPI0018695782|nr:hypothetical protein [Nostoc sp. MG11]
MLQWLTLRRKINHVDMDSFYASVEQWDNSGYRSKPLVVGVSLNTQAHYQKTHCF